MTTQPPLVSSQNRRRPLDGVETISTERLVLKPISEDVAQECFQFFTAELTRFMFPRPAENIEETLEFIRTFRQKRSDGTDLVVSIHRRENGEFLGCCGLHARKDQKAPELGIWVKIPAHGHGFGKEAVMGIMRWAEENLDVEGFIYSVDRQNAPSRKIPESLGGRVISEKKKPTASGSELDLIVFSVPLLSEK